MLVAALASVVAVGAAVGGAAVLDRGAGGGPGGAPDVTQAAAGDDAGDESPEPTWPEPPADGVLMPTSVPADLALAGLDRWDNPPTTGAAHSEQVFMAGGGAGIAVEVLPVWPGGGPAPMPTGEPVPVRGVVGRSAPAAYFAATDTTLAWQEDGVLVRATYTGLTEREATALLGALRWRSGDRSRGFDTTAGDRLWLVDEVEPGSGTGRTDRVAEFLYRSAAGREVRVRTATTVTQGTPLSGAQLKLHADLRTDGGLETVVPETGTLVVQWRDGRGIWVDATGVTDAEVHELVDSLVRVDPAALATTPGGSP